MHFCFALVALAATCQTFGPTAAVTLQTFAPCEDLSPHCPALCVSCDVSKNWVHGSFQLSAPEHHGRQALPSSPSRNSTGTLGSPARDKRSAYYVREEAGPPPERPDWLPRWVPWWSELRRGHHGQRQGHHGGRPGGRNGHGGHSSEHSGAIEVSADPPSKECGDLVNGGRQLIEAFCPKSCGRCGRSSSPLAAARIYISAQCTAAKQPAVPEQKIDRGPTIQQHIEQ